jgi:hypothetical protein
MKLSRRFPNIPALILVVAANVNICAQTLIWSDNFDNNKPDAWEKGWLGQMAETNQQFRIGGSFGRTPINEPAETYAFALHGLPLSGVLQDQQKLEARVDLVEANPSSAWASLQFHWPEGRAYALFMDEDEIMLAKAWVPPTLSVAFFFHEARAVKNQNVTLVLSLTRRGEDIRIETRVLDKDGGGAVLFERSVIDSPLSDPVPDHAREFPGLPDPKGTPWPILKVPGNLELGMCWADPQQASAGLVEVVFDNLEVRLYEWPALSIQQLPDAVLLSWPLTRGQFVLECAPGIDGPYAQVSDPLSETRIGQNEITIQAPGRTQFFRLHQVD